MLEVVNESQVRKAIGMLLEELEYVFLDLWVVWAAYHCELFK